jgi:NADPH-dependent 2,4-dienoyl-CoA reductase/sulfur reductase-like enzyme
MLGHEYEGEIKEAEVKKKVAIVGAGPAGLYAAIASKKRGHDVTVYEKAEHAGGNFYTASIPPCKGEITDFIVWQTSQCKQLGIEIKYNTEATAQMIKDGAYDSVILATGSNPILPPIKGLDGENVCFAKDLLEGRVKPGSNCVVIGGGQVGGETAHFLAQLLRNVTLIEMTSEIAADAAIAVKWHLTEALEKRKVNILTNSTVCDVTDTSVTYKDSEGNLVTIPADTVVIAAGYRANNPLEKDLQDSKIEIKVVGDAVKARKVLDATREGYDAGCSL